MIELLIFGNPEFDGYQTFSVKKDSLQDCVDYLKDYPNAEYEIRTSSTLQLIANLWSDECTDDQIRDAKGIWEIINERKW